MVYEAVDVDANIIFGALIDDSIVDGQVASSSYTTLHTHIHLHNKRSHCGRTVSHSNYATNYNRNRNYNL